MWIQLAYRFPENLTIDFYEPAQAVPAHPCLHCSSIKFKAYLTHVFVFKKKNKNKYLLSIYCSTVCDVALSIQQLVYWPDK